MAFLGADFDFFVEEAFFFDRHHAGESVAFEVRLFGEPFENAEDVLCWVEGSLAWIGDYISLVDFAVQPLIAKPSL